MATDTSFSSNVDKTVQAAIDGTVNLMKAAAKVPTIKSFVVTSSRIAVYAAQYGVDGEYPLPETFSDYFYDLAVQCGDEDPLKPVLTCELLILDYNAILLGSLLSLRLCSSLSNLTVPYS